MAFRQVDCRIAAYLLRLSKICSKAVQITHEEIAQELGTSSEVVSRILKTLEKKEMLSLGRGRILLKNLDELQQISKFERC